VELIGCPETSVRNYHSALCNISEEQRPHITICRCRPWLAPHGRVQSFSVWCNVVQCFICKL